MRSLGQHLEANGVDLACLRRTAAVVADVIRLGGLSNGSNENDLDVVYSFVGWNSSQKESMPFDGMVNILMSAKKQDLDTLRKSLGYRFPRGGKADCARNIVLFLRAFDWESLRVETAQLNPTSSPAVEANSSFLNNDWTQSTVGSGQDGLLTRYEINEHDRTGQILPSKSLGNIYADISLGKIDFLQVFTPFAEPVGAPIASPRFLFWISADANLALSAEKPRQFSVRFQTQPLRHTDMFEEQVHLRFLRVENVGGAVKNVTFSPHGWTFVVNDKLVTAEHIIQTQPVTSRRGKKRRQQAPTAHVNLTSLLRESGGERAPSENEIRIWNVRLQELPQACLHIFFPQVVRSKSNKALVDEVRDATDRYFARLGCSPCPARELENRALEDQAAAVKSKLAEGKSATSNAAPTLAEKSPASSSRTPTAPEGSDARQEKRKGRKPASVRTGNPATSRLEFAKKRASMMLWSSERGLEVEQVKFSLKCPLSLSRIDIPAKGVDCPHVQCFDLVAFLRLARRSNTRECPVCCRWMTGNDSMYICPLYEDTLRRFPESDEAEFFPDGRIEPISTGKAVIPGHGGKKTEVVDIDDVSEAEFATPLQTRHPSQTPAASAFPMKVTGPTSTRAAHIHQSAIIDLTSENEDLPRSHVADASPSGRFPRAREPDTSDELGASSNDSTCSPLPSAHGLDRPNRPRKTPRKDTKGAEHLATTVPGVGSITMARRSAGGNIRVSAFGRRRSESSEDSRSFAEGGQPHSMELRKRLRSNDRCSTTAGSTPNCSTPHTSTPKAPTPNGDRTFSQHQHAADVEILDLT